MLKGHVGSLKGALRRSVSFQGTRVCSHRGRILLNFMRTSRNYVYPNGLVCRPRLNMLTRRDTTNGEWETQQWCYCLNRMASRCCREGPGVGWRGEFVCAHCNMFAVSHPSTSRSQHGAVAAAKQDSSWASFLRGSAWTYGHGLQGVAWWRARAGGRPQMGPHAPWKFVRNPNEPRKSCSERWVGWRGEVCIHALQRIPPP